MIGAKLSPARAVFLAQCEAHAQGRAFSDVDHHRAMQRMDENFNAMHGRYWGERAEQDRAAIARIDAKRATAAPGGAS